MNRLFGLGMLGQRRILDALADLVAFDLGTLLGRNRFVDISRHGVRQNSSDCPGPQARSGGDAEEVQGVLL